MAPAFLCFHGSRLAWFPSSPTVSFLVDSLRCPLESRRALEDLKMYLDRAKSYRHSNAPIVYDYQLKSTNDSIHIDILTSNYKKTCVGDMLKIGETISLSNCRLIANACISLMEDFGSTALDYIDVSKIWFDEDMSPVFSGISYTQVLEKSESVRPQVLWDLGHLPFARLGLLVAEIVAGNLTQFSSVSHCISKLSKVQLELGDFLKLVLDMGADSAVTLEDVKADPFLSKENQPGARMMPGGLMAENSNISPAELAYIPTLRDGNTTSRYHTDFEEMEFLGKGGFGSVLKAKNLIDGRFYAIKKIRLNPQDKEGSRRLIREVQTLSRLQSEYVVRFAAAANPS
ncbi:Eukaryotic translation initiation factor 2 alpha kinase 4 [Kappamyces sp. JEL0680]|nr:Eukaryotic translation initiation factor 2 alpha kinase 4 [Kappamyces sp. JEL0680]